MIKKELLNLLTLSHKKIGVINDSALLWNGFKNQRERELYLYGRKRALEDAMYFTEIIPNEEIETSKLDWHWIQGSEMTWEEAKQYAHSLNTMSESGWRLPTRAELIEAQLDEVDGFSSELYWSSMESTETSEEAWVFDFEFGKPHKWVKTKKCKVRCVR
jgi:hypothetical protein